MSSNRTNTVGADKRQANLEQTPNLTKPKSITEVVEVGDVESLKEFLAKGTASDQDANLVSLASRYNQVTVLNYLLKEKYSVNTQDEETWWTPLHHAIDSNSLDATELLLKNGANKEARGKDGLRPLHVGAKRNAFHPLLILLQHGAEVDSVELKGFQAIHFIAEGGFVGLANLLLGVGADNKTRFKGSSGRENVVADVNAKTESGWTPLHYASGRGHVELIHLFCNNGAVANAQSDDGTTPLYFASEVGNVEAVQALLFHKADPNIARNGGISPIFWNALLGRVDMLKILIEGGVKLDATTEQGETAMIVASGKGNLPVVKVLLDVNANPHIAMKTTGQTALHKAVKHGHVDVVEELVKRGANYNATMTTGETPLIVAIKDCHVNVKEILKILLHRKVDLDHKDDKGRAAIHYAAQHGDIETMMALLEAGANVNLITSDGKTPLHLCAKNGHVELLKILAVRCKSINSVDMNGNSSLHMAVKSKHVESARFLLTLRPTLAPNVNGDTPLEIAKQVDDQKLVAYIEQFLVMRRLEINRASLTKSLDKLDDRISKAHATRDRSIEGMLKKLKDRAILLNQQLSALEHDTSILPSIQPTEELKSKCQKLDDQTRIVAMELKAIGISCVVSVPKKEFKTEYEMQPGVGEDTLRCLAEIIGPDFWISLGIELGFTEDHMLSIESDAGAELETAIFLMLTAWRERSPGDQDDKVEFLKKAFVACDKHDIADLLEYMNPRESVEGEQMVSDTQELPPDTGDSKQQITTPESEKFVHKSNLKRERTNAEHVPEVKTTANVIREAIQRNFQELAKYLKPKPIVELYSRRKVLGPYELTRIRSAPSEQDQSFQLLSILLYEQPASQWAEAFFSYLQTHQQNLYEKVNQSAMKEKMRLTLREGRAIENL